jgi:hypothetical protein
MAKQRQGGPGAHIPYRPQAPENARGNERYLRHERAIAKKRKKKAERKNEGMNAHESTAKRAYNQFRCKTDKGKQQPKNRTTRALEWKIDEKWFIKIQTKCK